MTNATNEAMLMIPGATSAIVATQNAERLTSLETLVRRTSLSDRLEDLPHILMQVTAVTKTAWAYTAKVLKEIRDTGIWEKIDDGKYEGNWKEFLDYYTRSTDYSAGRASNLLGYMEWIDRNYQKIMKAKPEGNEKTEPQIPREKTMKFIMQYQQAFEQSDDLLSLVFWKEVYDAEILQAEISAAMGDSYVASRQNPEVTSRKLGGKSTAPTFGAYVGGANTEASNVLGQALNLVVSRTRDLVCVQGVYDTLDKKQRSAVRGEIEQVIAKILQVDGEL
jgi:hypothetical protein